MKASLVVAAVVLVTPATAWWPFFPIPLPFLPLPPLPFLPLPPPAVPPPPPPSDDTGASAEELKCMNAVRDAVHASCSPFREQPGRCCPNLSAVRDYCNYDEWYTRPAFLDIVAHSCAAAAAPSGSPPPATHS